jgi:hypothetical protein
MPVLRCPHLPPRCASGGWLTPRVGRSNPSTRQRHPLYPRSLAEARSLPLTVTCVGRVARGIPRDRALCSHKQSATERRRPLLPMPKGRGLLAEER